MATQGPVGWGILGTGMIAKKVAAAVKPSREYRLAAVASRELPKAEAFAKEFGSPETKAYGSYDELLADKSVEAVYISFPNALHHEWTIRCAQAKKHVLCEKPLAVTGLQAQEMINACRENGVLLMEAFMYRCHPAAELMKATAHSGIIGEIRYVRSSFCFGMKDLANVRLSASLHGGVLMDVGCYCVNFSRFIAGGEPVEVSAVAEFGQESKVDEVFSGTLRFANNIHAQFHVSFRGSGYRSTEIMGTKGFLRIENPWFAADTDVLEVVAGKDSKKIPFPPGDRYQFQFERFGRALRGQGKLPFEPEDGLRNTLAIDALLQSARTGSAVRLK
ncbi:MAG: Gfo/Idh/MocA family oxidoreductase [Planctomycetes bacterium]|nr:Gfo/Idh/MocA family oxidoreductase [Planctomycetota bacterium]